MPISWESKPLRHALHGVVLAGLVGGSLGYVALDKTVVVTVDGVTTRVHMYGGTVADALDRAGVRVGEHDVVTPGIDQHVGDGSHVVVAHGRPLALTLNGRPRTVWVTQPNVEDALAALNMRLDGAYVSASRSGRIPLTGAALTMRLPQRLVVVADGKRRSVVTTAPSVATMLSEQGVTLGPRDIITVPLGRYPTDGAVVQVKRVQIKRVRTTAKVIAPIRRVASAALYKGTTKVSTGAAGRVTRVWQLTIVDGRISSRRLVRNAKTAPKATIVYVGSKDRPKPAPRRWTGPSGTSSGGGLNWAALARCESGGRPSAYSPPYYGMYQFSLGTWRSVGGSGMPNEASAAEQTYRAQVLYAREGRSPWPVCGRYL